MTSPDHCRITVNKTDGYLLYWLIFKDYKFKEREYGSWKTFKLTTIIYFVRGSLQFVIYENNWGCVSSNWNINISDLICKYDYFFFLENPPKKPMLFSPFTSLSWSLGLKFKHIKLFANIILLLFVYNVDIISPSLN